jgi:lipoprotein NlpD
MNVVVDLAYRTALTLVVALMVTACAGGGIFSPDVDYDDSHSRSRDYRIVLRGETLYSIAWDVGVDYETLASWNGISAPYLLKAGQRLRIAPPETGGDAAPATTSGPGRTDTYYRVQGGDTVYGVARKTGTRMRDIVAWNGLKKPYLIRPGQRLRIAAPATSRSGAVERPRSASAPRVTARPRGRPVSVGKWLWPTAGKIGRGFSPSNGSKGVDIVGREGQPIVASAGGQVVYQGSGLRGYGKLIIIKHNTDYLSAYAHCSTILVKEGATVTQGERIATMGRTGTTDVKLHFEIRLRGNPVNPLSYLPRHS